MHPAPLVLAVAFALALVPCADARQSIVVKPAPEAGDKAVVELPWDEPGANWVLEESGGSGARIPAQALGGRLRFIVPNDGRERVLVARPAGEDVAAPAARSVATNGQVVLQLDGQAVAGYLAGPGRLPRPGIPEIYLRGGYLHPVRTPAGRVITDDYPPNHVHHHGFWSAWTRTRFEDRHPDFWNMGEGTARVDFRELRQTVEGPVWCGFESVHVFTDLRARPPRAVLEEVWNVRLYAMRGGPAHVMDIEIEQRVLGDESLILPRYYYGGFGYRGPWAWNGPGALRYMDSNGCTDRVAANETRVRWYWVGGDVEGHLSGVVVMGHPDNPRAPQPVRVHPNEPFVCWAPSQLGDWSIDPGSAYRARYRILPMDGEPDPEWIERWWRDYVAPPDAELQPGDGSRG